jgi:hypothetical protein
MRACQPEAESSLNQTREDFRERATFTWSLADLDDFWSNAIERIMRGEL